MGAIEFSLRFSVIIVVNDIRALWYGSQTAFIHHVDVIADQWYTRAYLFLPPILSEGHGTDGVITARSLREGNVFTRVCLSFCLWGEDGILSEQFWTGPCGRGVPVWLCPINTWDPSPPYGDLLLYGPVQTCSLGIPFLLVSGRLAFNWKAFLLRLLTVLSGDSGWLERRLFQSGAIWARALNKTSNEAPVGIGSIRTKFAYSFPLKFSIATG